jgi:TRL-like protein family
MNKIRLAVCAVMLSGFLVSGCAAVASGPLMGVIYTDVKYPQSATSNSGSSKMGMAEATSILGLFATGDASIETAARTAGITKISHVDYEATSFLGIYAKYTVMVYGE